MGENDIRCLHCIQFDLLEFDLSYDVNVHSKV